MMLDDGVHDEELRQAARHLGAAAAERVDVERTAEAVLARLRAGDAPGRSRIRWMQLAWLRALAKRDASRTAEQCERAPAHSTIASCAYQGK